MSDLAARLREVFAAYKNGDLVDIQDVNMIFQSASALESADSRMAELQARVNELEKQINKYGKHLRGCKIKKGVYWKPIPGTRQAELASDSCSCGFAFLNTGGGK